jgi:hypothetical protein
VRCSKRVPGHTHPRAQLRTIKVDDRWRARLKVSLPLIRFHLSLWRADAMHYSSHLLASVGVGMRLFVQVRIPFSSHITSSAHGTRLSSTSFPPRCRTNDCATPSFDSLKLHSSLEFTE